MHIYKQTNKQTHTHTHTGNTNNNENSNVGASAIDAKQVRPIRLSDFKLALKQVRASVSESEIASYLEWNKKFGSTDIAATEADGQDDDDD